MADDLTEHLTPAQQVERDELNKAFRDVLKTASGKRVLFWMLEQCAIYEDAFAGDSINATNYRLGSQGSGRKLIAKLDEIDPRFYPKLLLDIADIKAMDRAAADALTKNTENDDHED